MFFFFIPISRWAIATVVQLLDIRREPGPSPVGYRTAFRQLNYRWILGVISFSRLSAMAFPVAAPATLPAPVSKGFV